MKNNDVQHYTTASHVSWEKVGSEVVILDTTSHTTHRLDGELAKAFLAAASGEPVATQDAIAKEVMALTQQGFLEPRSPVSRRTLMAAGVAGVGLGFTTLALPQPAAASSSGSSSTPPTPTITAASLVAGEWRWSPEQNGIDITQRQGSVLLPDTGEFVAGERWRLSLADLNGAPAQAEADVTPLAGRLRLVFSFPTADASQITTDLQGTLTKVDDPTVLSEQFPIPRV